MCAVEELCGMWVLGAAACVAGNAWTAVVAQHKAIAKSQKLTSALPLPTPRPLLVSPPEPCMHWLNSIEMIFLAICIEL